MGRWELLVGWLQLSGGGKCCFGALLVSFVRQEDPEAQKLPRRRPPVRRRAPPRPPQRTARHSKSRSRVGGPATLGSLQEESADNPTEMSN